MSRLLLVRHGATSFNSVRRFNGLADVEMSADGYTQIEKLSQRLASEKIDAIYSSDLKRAMATAQVIASQHKLGIVACPELREVNFGKIEGLTFQEISQLYPEVGRFISNFSLELAFPGGENFKEFVARVNKFLDRLKQHTPEQTILIVSHNGPQRALLCFLLGIGPEHWWQFRCENASLSVVETHPRESILTLLNDTSHLKTAC